MKRILFPTDFSPAAHNAFSYALHLAEKYQAEIVLFHTFHYAATGEFYISPELIDRVNLEQEGLAKEEFQRYINRVKTELNKEVPVQSKISYSFAIDGILNAVEETQADAIVMGTLGAGNAVGRFFGSVTSQVIEKVKIPVWAIPAKAVYEDLKDILYSTNFEEESFTVPPFVTDLAAHFNAHLTCIHVNKNSEDPWNRLSVAVKKDRLLSKEKPMDFFVLHETDVWKGLQSFLEKNPTNLLVTLTHPHSLFERIMHTSLTRKAVLESETPLLALHH
ncbi:MAG: universal stress protein [Bacteroidia bacterium]|nr:universal stress protein [Bacteroidia bacterium]